MWCGAKAAALPVLDRPRDMSAFRGAYAGDASFDAGAGDTVQFEEDEEPVWRSLASGYGSVSVDAFDSFEEEDEPVYRSTAGASESVAELWQRVNPPLVRRQHARHDLLSS